MENAIGGESLTLLLEALAASGSPPEVIETHLSWVALTDRFAYKLRKPVKFSFLDMLLADQRQRVGVEELQVLRQFALPAQPELLALARTAWGEVRLGTGAHPIDWVLKMRRQPSGTSLSGRWLRGMTLVDERRLESLLERLFSAAPPVFITPADYVRRLEQRIRENEEDLSNMLSPRLQGISRGLHATLLEFCSRLGDTWQQRVCDGRIVAGHGNLRPDHIFLADPPIVIDGMECGAHPRCLDTCEELSALLLECDLADQSTLASRLQEWYANAVSERPDERLWSFYKCLRAVWRSKTDILASRRRGPAWRRTPYFAWARHYAQQLGVKTAAPATSARRLKTRSRGSTGSPLSVEPTSPTATTGHDALVGRLELDDLPALHSAHR